MEHEIAGELCAWLAEEHSRLARSWFFSRRYIAKDVDTFLREIGTTLERGELPEPSQIRDARFHVTTDLRPGYKLRAVDDVLTESVVRVIVARRGIDPASGAAMMIARTERARFRITWRGGYDFREVDMFMKQVKETLAQGAQPSAALAFTVRRRGFAKLDVDAFTEELRDYAL